MSKWKRWGLIVALILSSFVLSAYGTYWRTSDPSGNYTCPAGDAVRIKISMKVSSGTATLYGEQANFRDSYGGYHYTSYDGSDVTLTTSYKVVRYIYTGYQAVDKSSIGADLDFWDSLKAKYWFYWSCY
jgi:hypothetical protein